LCFPAAAHFRAGKATDERSDTALAVQRNDSPRPSQQQQPLRRWEPFSELEQFNEQFERLIDRVWSPTGAGGAVPWIPLADIEETDDAWIVDLELASVDRKDIHVELRDNELVVTGEIKEKERKGVLRRHTRRTGEFEYRVMLPGQADEENIEANLHDGLLTVRVSKSDRARARRIEVKAA
jgi:HSP20 family protein